MTAEEPQNRYEAARSRLQAEDDDATAAFARRPLGPFLVKSLAMALAVGFVSYLISGWTWAVVVFLVWFLTDVGARMWARHRSGHAAPEQHP